ncbi:T9SS type B sorting domain-containing protein [Flavobacterium sp. MFBS3-15]|uniref:T9SS type B sorting domain-containing protein n=1 Tax=Flavobacterium sp. MFBS3-15 TaxID=2989816 RepID=UPI0022366D68|nr:T9SS type B sorting domain-containing protein [Flavobacterium sp. MFBS3-15]MCW4468332.1 T9SS type B sorting domain-containing protein [Flavobacterium sp. MFBS3-15]
MKFLKAFFVTGILFCTLAANAQLPDFGFAVDVENETCPGNGTLTFSISDAVPGAIFLFTVYNNSAPTVPVSSSPGLFVDGLSAGTYKIIALQTLGPETNIQQAEVIIEEQIEPLTYSITSSTHNCSEGGQIEITTLTGIASEYEIISGPVTRPLQATNVFYDLPPGQYNIRVFNNCGQGVVTTYTVSTAVGQPTVSPPIFDDVLSGDCTTVNITNTISYPPGTVISYPIDIVYTINIPGGDPQIVSLHFDTGAPSLLEFSNVFPVIPGQPYTYDIQVTNSCGIQYGNTGMEVNPLPSLSENLNPIPCGRFYFTLEAANYMPPFNLNFSAVPDGFDPAAFTGNYPGPYNDSPIVFGNEEQPVPEGGYTVSITDACGRTETHSFTIEYIVPEPNANGRNNGCYSVFGRITANIPEREIVFAEIISGPPEYTAPVPTDVTAFINPSGTLVVTDLPIGEYTLNLIDDCGIEYEEVVVIIPAFTERDFTATAFADCSTAKGAVRVSSGNGRLTSLSVIDAPDEFEETLPYDVTSNINTGGVMFMDNLPEGEYTFHGIDICGIQRSVTITITGYQPGTGTSFAFDPNCSSFDIDLFDNDSSGTPTYWLQKENPDVPGQWVHPATNVVYTEGTLPTAQNSLSLQNSQTTVNLLYFGSFRIVKAFETVGSGVASKICFQVLGNFNYYDGVNIENIYNISCLPNTDDIYIEATGLEPLQYRIERRNGEPFLMDNGTNNIFTDLPAASYQFVVEDACGHIGRRTENINLLPELADAHDPGGMMQCIQPGESVSREFDLSEQNAGILEDQSPSVYTITYHATQEDADNGADPLPILYTNTANPQIIYARLVHNYISICHDVVPFGLQVSEYPQLSMERETYICQGNGPVTLTADPGFDSYEWSTGETTNSIQVDEPGNYSVRVANVYGDVECETTTDITVNLSEEPSINEIETDDWTDNHNSITIHANGAGSYEYSIDGDTYQDSPVFSDLATGIYYLHIRDINGCGSLTQMFYLLNYPKFFTPNGDGVNDTWRIKYSSLEPDMEIYVFDRYGKFIISFPPESEGWDGTYNGRPLPSTDYWFVVKREDGEIHRGHFTMKR